MVNARYMLDTNICIYLMKGAPAALLDRFAACKQGEVIVSAVTWAKLCSGLNVHNSQAQMSALQKALNPTAFDTQAAAVFGALSQQFPARKSSFDRMIAAHAIALGLTLVTNNTTDFALYADAGLVIENWVT